MEDAVAAMGCCAGASVLCRWAGLACSLRSTSAVTTHLRLAREVRACILCVRLTVPGDTFYSCGVCEDRHDICARCHDDSRALGVGERSSRAEFARHPMHREVLPLLVETTSLAAARSTAGALVMAFQLYRERRCLGTRRAAPGAGFGEYEWLTYGQTLEAALSFGAGLRALLPRESEAGPAPLVGVLGAVCADWLVSDYGCALKGLGVVLMHRATGAAQLCHILRSTGLRALIISRHLRHVLGEALLLAPETGAALLRIIWLDDSADAHAQAVACGGDTDHTELSTGASEHQWADVAQHGAEQPASARRRVVDSLDGDAIVKLLPSSGTTGGAPKLTVVTEATLWHKLMGTASRSGAGRSMAGTVVVFAYEVMRQSHDVLMQGGSIGFFSGSLTRMQEDCQRLRPTAFAATPTFWVGLLAQFESEVRRRSGGRASESDAEGEVTIEWMDRRVLGNRLQILVSTGAPLAHRVNRWLFRIFGRTIVNAYGTTETGGLASNGLVSAGAEVRLIDCPQLGYTTADKPHPRGEILAHTRRVAGYFERGCLRADGTFDAANSTSDEWVTLSGVRYFRTGDIGELLGKGQVRVIDRCKSYFKLAQGIFVAPQPVDENSLGLDLGAQKLFLGPKKDLLDCISEFQY
jgi:long-chain acyl-CoA synthetase